MRHGNGQSRADQTGQAGTQREVTAERELLPQTAIEQYNHAANGALAEPVATIWRVLRGMGVPDEEALQATRISFDHAFAQLASAVEIAVPTLSGVPLGHVIDPLLAAAYDSARAAWRPLVHNPLDGEVSSSRVRFQGELLVLGLLGTLDEVKRSCLLLADMERFSSPEIAALTGLRLDVVYDELRKARKGFERARKRYDQAGATLDAANDAPELLSAARMRFSPAPAELAGLCNELSERFGAWESSVPRDPEPGSGSAA